MCHESASVLIDSANPGILQNNVPKGRTVGTSSNKTGVNVSFSAAFNDHILYNKILNFSSFYFVKQVWILHQIQILYGMDGTVVFPIQDTGKCSHGPDTALGPVADHFVIIRRKTKVNIFHNPVKIPGIAERRPPVVLCHMLIEGNHNIPAPVIRIGRIIRIARVIQYLLLIPGSISKAGNGIPVAVTGRRSQFHIHLILLPIL